MDEVIKYLGVHYGEHFEILGTAGKLKGEFFFVPEENFFQSTDPAANIPEIFYKLLSEEYAIVNLPFHPSYGEMYFYVNRNGNVLQAGNSNSTEDINFIRLGNCYETEDEAKMHIKFWV